MNKEKALSVALIMGALWSVMVGGMFVLSYLFYSAPNPNDPEGANLIIWQPGIFHAAQFWDGVLFTSVIFILASVMAYFSDGETGNSSEP